MERSVLGSLCVFVGYLAGWVKSWVPDQKVALANCTAKALALEAAVEKADVPGGALTIALVALLVGGGIFLGVFLTLIVVLAPRRGERVAHGTDSGAVRAGPLPGRGLVAREADLGNSGRREALRREPRLRALPTDPYLPAPAGASGPQSR